MSKDGKAKVSLKKKVGHEEAVTILEDLLKGFKTGNMILQNGEESITLSTSDKISLEIKAKTKKLKNKLSIELSWKTDSLETDDFSITEAVDEAETEQDASTADISNKAKVIKKAE
ncbi:amphi-Trp domain-containing protein [Maridesulfovibrio sp.]|uniref:amphi-Trp domain-containing protein n=1 Tax=Maridesulfovibrio sp. TaxID=2795000 RepID=UPI0029F4949A|nr:amphi-Trp domain-containing protein [Maridesulfovibrio sp.]